MLYQIMDGTVSLGGQVILSHVDFEIKGNEKIALVGKNGAGKTTLLRLLAGELSLDRDDRRQGRGIVVSRHVTVGMLHQQARRDDYPTVEQELLEACPYHDSFERERYLYEMEYDLLFTGFGFVKSDKQRRLSEFSGGEQTKIRMIRLFLTKPDILLLDEPTNHLDTRTTEWLEEYLRSYDRAVVMVSHDRFFLDQTAEIIYEVEDGRLNRYAGNYTQFRLQKQKKLARQQKAYELQQDELKRLDDLVERFKHKPRKAAFARAKKKQRERIKPVEKPKSNDIPMMPGELTPLISGSKLVLEAEHLFIGYQAAITDLSLRIRRGQKIGVLGDNGAGKTAFLKTVAGLLPPVKGEIRLGRHITIGYFDQQTADLKTGKTVLEYFHDEFPSLTEKEARTILGRFLFAGGEAGKKVERLSGGEKARLELARLMQSRPNFLLLDEPTNHMDIQAREVLEAALGAYTGTILFVSHDRYFTSRIADALLIFEPEAVLYYPFGYEHYADRKKQIGTAGSPVARQRAEEQALIAGLREVPRAERHQLREIPEEEAYLDWQLRLAGERMEQFREQAQRCFEKKEQATMQEAYFTENRRLEAEYEDICQAWTVSCLAWYDISEEKKNVLIKKRAGCLD